MVEAGGGTDDDPMTVPVTLHDGSGHTVVVPQGRLYFDTIEPLRKAMLALAVGEPARVVLDLSRVETCDSAALNLMVEVHRTVAGKDGWLRLVGPRPHVRRALEVTNLTRLLPVYDTVAEAAL
jgi:anti-sigma B factor antagonist